MEVEAANKRKLDSLTPPINEVQKRYMWTPSILTQNKFFLPSNLEAKLNDNPGKSEDTDNITKTQTTKPKIPPIYLDNAINHTELITDIKTLITGEFTTFCSASTLRINLTKEDDYRILTKYFSDNKIKHYTFQNPNGKLLNVVIKNVPLSLTEQEILNELSATVPVIKVTRLLTKNKQPLPVCAVDLTDNDNGKKIFSLKSIYYSIVTVELRRKSTDTPQCHRCQRYGHTKNYCSLDPRCVKCAGNHPHQECNKQPEEAPKCANCGGPHAASYRGCSHHTELIKKRMKNRQPNTGHERNYFVNQNQSYANRAQNPLTANPNLSSTNHPAASSDSNNIIKILIDLLTPYLPQIKNFITNTILPLLFNGP